MRAVNLPCSWPQRLPKTHSERRSRVGTDHDGVIQAQNGQIVQHAVSYIDSGMRNGYEVERAAEHVVSKCIAT